MAGAFLDAAEGGITVDSTDYVIVGSGAGGGAAARVLSEAGYSVVVLEEGPLVPTAKLGMIAGESLAALMRNQGQLAAVGGGFMPILQGRCVGGTTFVNSAIVWRLPQKVLSRWRTDFGFTDGLPDADLEDAYETIERDMSVRPVGDFVASGSDLKLAQGAKLAGIESRPLHRYDKDCKGSGRCLHGCPNNAKQSTAINYLRRAVEANALVFSHATGHRVITEQGRATAIICKVTDQGPLKGKQYRINVRRAVILSGSVFGSPYLLRRSRIATGSSALGHHFMAHPGMAVAGFYDEPVNMWSGAAQGYEAIGLRDSLGLKFESINVPPEVAASRLPGAGERFRSYLDRLPNVGIWSLAVKAEAQGTVRQSWLMGDLVKYVLTKNDLARVREGIKKLAEMHFLAGAKEVIPAVHGAPETLTSPDQLGLLDQIELDPKNFSMLASHLFGTCRAGPDPKTSVVDQYLRVHGVEGLYVMDASVFPSNTGVNPQHSIMAIATVAAKRLAAVTAKPVAMPEVAAADQMSAAASM